VAAINLAKLSQIPYLDIANLQGRFISTLTFHDAGKWRMWLMAGDQLLEVKAWPAEACYFSSAPEAVHDIYFHFLDFIAQRASFDSIQKPILGLRDDIFNLSASIAKIAHLHATRDALKTGVSRMVITEVEYIFSVCKSIFDLLQEIICVLWHSTRLLDIAVEKKPLKETFAKTILHGGRVSTAEELRSRFGLPASVSDFYVRHAEFFMTLRDFRNNIIHRGSQFQTIYSAESGFLVNDSIRPFSSMKIWREEEKDPNGLAPLVPALGVVIRNTLAACEDFSLTVQQVIQFPPPIAPGMKFYMRSYFNEAFSAVLEDANERVIRTQPSH
jgi:hypothetical protein